MYLRPLWRYKEIGYFKVNYTGVLVWIHCTFVIYGKKFTIQWNSQRGWKILCHLRSFFFKQLKDAKCKTTILSSAEIKYLLHSKLRIKDYFLWALFSKKSNFCGFGNIFLVGFNGLTFTELKSQSRARSFSTPLPWESAWRFWQQFFTSIEKMSWSWSM